MSIYSKQDLQDMKKYFHNINNKFDIRFNFFNQINLEITFPQKIKSTEKIISVLDNYKSVNFPYEKSLHRQFRMLNQLLIKFFINRKNLSTKAQQTFWHEWGHIYEATRLGYDFTIIIIKDCLKHHLFYIDENEETIEYTFLKVNLFCSYNFNKSNGVAYFRKDTLVSEEIQKIALGGFMQDFTKKQKKPKKIAIFFGFTRILYKVKKGSDADFIIGNIDEKILEKWQDIYNYLYSKENCLNSLSDNSYPFKKYKKKIASLK